MSDSGGTIGIDENATLEAWDIVIIVGYFVIIMCVGLFVSIVRQLLHIFGGSLVQDHVTRNLSGCFGSFTPETRT